MKTQTTLLLLGVLLVVAQGTDFIHWGGRWDLTWSATSDTTCYPDTTISIEETVTQLTTSWVWANTQGCITAQIAGQKFSQTVKRPEGNSVGLLFSIGGAEVAGTFTMGLNSATFKSINGASATFARRDDLAYFSGTWDIVTQDNNLCNPDKSITLTQIDAKQVKGEWTWDNSAACQAGGIAGKKFSDTILVEGSTAVVAFKINNVDFAGFFSVLNDQAFFYSILYGGSASFVRRQESVKWVGTWNIDSKQVGTGCFPDTSIVITEEKGSITAKWTWANSDFCTLANLAGKEFSLTDTTPRGRAISLGVLANNAIIAGIFTINGDQATFSSANGASATFTRKSSSMMIIIIILLVVVVAAGGYFYVKKSKAEKVQSDLNASLGAIYSRT